MAPKTFDWTSGRADRIESQKITATDTSTLLPFYNMVPQYERHHTGVGRACHTPYSVSFEVPTTLTEEPAATPAATSSYLSRKRAQCPYVGLRNVGNTCYLNCLLQYLFVNCSFRKCILEDAIAAAGDRVSHSLKLLFCTMQESCQQVSDPSDFVDAAGLSSGAQEDVTEMLGFLMAYLGRITKGAVTRLVSFEENTSVICSGCKLTSKRQELFCELHVRVKPPAAGSGHVLGCRQLQLETELFNNFATEQLTDDNQYYCDTCGRLNNAERSRTIQTLPPFLHIVVSRSYWDVEANERKKVCDPLGYPEILDLADFVDPTVAKECGQSKFELIAVLEHHSQLSDSGHYTAILREPVASLDAAVKDDTNADTLRSRARWWRFDDSRVTSAHAPGVEVSPPPIQDTVSRRRWESVGAYMLAYRRLSAVANGCEDTYRELAQIVTSPDLKEAVAAHDAKAEANKKDSDELQSLRLAIVFQRIQDIQLIPSKLAHLKGAAVRDCSLVPMRWLQDWNYCREVDVSSDSPVRVDYSDVLLPRGNDQSARPKLDPFAAWEGRAIVLPTKVLTDVLFAPVNGNKPKLVPVDLTVEDLSVESFLCHEAAGVLQNLMRCAREIMVLIGKIRDGYADPPAGEPGPGNVLVRASVMTDLNKYFGMFHKIQTGRGRRKTFSPSSVEVLGVLLGQRKRGTRVSMGFEESSVSRVADNVVSFDLTAGLMCAHGLVVSNVKSLRAPSCDIDRLINLFGDMKQLWRRLSIRVPGTLQCRQNLPESASNCETCSQQLKEERAAKRQKTREQEISRGIVTRASGQLGINDSLSVNVTDTRGTGIAREWAQDFKIPASGTTVGSSLKNLIVKEVGLKELHTGNLMLFVNGQSVGDKESPLEVLSKSLGLAPENLTDALIPLTAEIYDVNLPAPVLPQQQQHKPRSSISGLSTSLLAQEASERKPATRGNTASSLGSTIAPDSSLSTCGVISLEGDA